MIVISPVDRANRVRKRQLSCRKGAVFLKRSHALERTTIVKMRSVAYVETSGVSHLTSRPSRDFVPVARQQMTREWWRTARDRIPPRRFGTCGSRSQAGRSECRSCSPDEARRCDASRCD